MIYPLYHNILFVSQNYAVKSNIFYNKLQNFDRKIEVKIICIIIIYFRFLKFFCEIKKNKSFNTKVNFNTYI